MLPHPVNDHEQINKDTKIYFMKSIKQLALLVVVALSSHITFGQEKSVEVGGAPMYPSKTIVENAVNSSEHTTLVAAVKAAGLVETLQGSGPFTVFAPTNSAFDKLPAGTVETLLKEENKQLLTSVLTYHVVPGRLDSKQIATLIKAGNGKAELTTVQGGKLWAWMEGKNLVLKDEKGGTSTVGIADVYQSNGVIHVIDNVAMPKS